MCTLIGPLELVNKSVHSWYPQSVYMYLIVIRNKTPFTRELINRRINPLVQIGKSFCQVAPKKDKIIQESMGFYC